MVGWDGVCDVLWGDMVWPSVFWSVFGVFGVFWDVSVRFGVWRGVSWCRIVGDSVT